MNFIKNPLHIRFGLLLSLLLIGWVTGCATSNHLYGRGKQHFILADYHSAYKELYPVARAGKADAQYAVGYMQYYGLGTLRNRVSGMQWMEKSAKQGNKTAQQAIQQIQNSC